MVNMEWVNNETIVNIISIINMVLTSILTSIALIFAIKSYKLKSGQSIRGLYSTASSIACEDGFISSIELENYKDKAIIIYIIYLKIGHNCYIELETFEDNPLILNPFEVYKKNYDPIDLYSVNSNRVSIEKLLGNRKIKHSIVLSTSNGKYKVKKSIKYWDVTGKSFKNHMTAIVRPNRSIYKSKSYGCNAKYLVDLKYHNGFEDVIPIYKEKYDVFKNFTISSENIQSKSKLEFLLNQMKLQGKLTCTEFEVIDIGNFREEMYKRYEKDIYDIEHANWVTYHIVGRLITILDDYKLHCENKKIEKRNRKLNN